MLLQSQIHYKTHPGQHLRVVGSHDSLGNGVLEQAAGMNLIDVSSGLWQLHLEVKALADFSYPYAAFSYLRDRFETPDFTHWKDYLTVTDEEINQLTDPASDRFDDIAVHYFIQFHAHKQLERATDYARTLWRSHRVCQAKLS